MKPTNFPEQNMILNKPSNMTDKECQPLPVLWHESGFASCWKMTIAERIKVLITGIVWLDIAGKSHPPVCIRTDKPFLKNQSE